MSEMLLPYRLVAVLSLLLAVKSNIELVQSAESWPWFVLRLVFLAVLIFITFRIALKGTE